MLHDQLNLAVCFCGLAGGSVHHRFQCGQVLELTEAARAFLVAAFQRADRDADGALSPSDCDELFSTAPAACAAMLDGPLSSIWMHAHGHLH